MGSRDASTGQLFYPPRELSVDGELRSIELSELPTVGVLHSFAPVDGVVFGLVDLDGAVRLQCEITGGTPEIGAEYRLVGDDSGWRFARA